ncbi:MAG TPA: 50S ribosomal protein L9 [Candidatus Aminicenantes bacterium]|nr:50S ribosomal protein L9 [Candidatus Aminicenantes bacterium]
MKVILKQDVENLGSKGDIVDIAPGFGRNYLIPKKIALEVTSSNMKMIEIERRALKKKLEKERQSFEGLIQKLNQVVLTFKRKSGEKDMIFGSVSSSDIKDALDELGFEIDKKKILLEEPIKRLGNYSVPIKIFHEDRAEIKVEVLKPEEEIEKEKEKEGIPEEEMEEAVEEREEPEEEQKKEEELPEEKKEKQAETPEEQLKEDETESRESEGVKEEMEEEEEIPEEKQEEMEEESVKPEIEVQEKEKKEVQEEKKEEEVPSDEEEKAGSEEEKTKKKGKKDKKEQKGEEKKSKK